MSDRNYVSKLKLIEKTVYTAIILEKIDFSFLYQIVLDDYSKLYEFRKQDLTLGCR